MVPIPRVTGNLMGGKVLFIKSGLEGWTSLITTIGSRLLTGDGTTTNRNHGLGGHQGRAISTTNITTHRGMSSHRRR
ncbi:hypothetical protein CEE36_01565 [candidate division TA06 bacterium B3_TA06]|uniref:Uncharacterized protein n=1 Tax=candidate division TA06 bacterium B3_TA06 TaxID=2012487 RepID=A0A532V9K2_UNCT6|nr:MAG: hypothetical protein CEE36_01565 [candidate division TA06 bacterium B3_TA06]